MEVLFGQLPLVGIALLAAGLLIIRAGRMAPPQRPLKINTRTALLIGLSQGLCLPFRGLSRSGTTISTGMLLGSSRRRVEEFSFALAVLITPPAIVQELHRLLKAQVGTTQAGPHLSTMLGSGIVGMVAAFGAGLLALRLLSDWLENGHWSWFGNYCLGFAAFIFLLAAVGF